MRFVSLILVVTLLEAVSPSPLQPNGGFSPTVDTRAFCGQQKLNQSRIVGGSEAVPHEYPWQAALTIDNTFFCGGSLISADWLITAAHCVDEGKEISVLLGAHDRSISEPSQLVVMSYEYVMHPGWDTGSLHNDIALVKLSQPVTFTNEIAPVCVAPETEPNHDGDELVVSGWGWTSDADHTFASTLQKVAVPGISNSACTSTFGNLITTAHICVDTIGARGPCTSDTGGPLTFVSGGIHRLVGVGSFGSSRGCELGLPFVFTRVSSFAAWITAVTGLSY